MARITATLGRHFDDATWSSRLAATLRTYERWLRASYVFRWLTAEPDPGIVIIDLRETYTVAPFITFLDRLQPGVEATWDTLPLDRIANRFEPNSELFARATSNSSRPRSNRQNSLTGNSDSEPQ